MHILLIPAFYPTDLDPVSGKFFQDQALALRRQGIEVGVAYFEGRSLRRGFSFRALCSHCFKMHSALEQSIPTVRLRGWNTFAQCRWGAMISAYLGACAVDRYIAQYGRPDLLHAHQGHWAGYVAYLVWKRHRIPYVVTEHESSFAEKTIPAGDFPALRLVYANAKQVMAVSHALASAMREAYDPASIMIVPNMVDTASFALSTRQEARGAQFTFLCVARLAKIKRLDVLLQAFAAAFTGRQGVALRIIGHGPEYQSLLALTSTLQLTAQVKFSGGLPHAEVLLALQTSDALVLCSDIETFGVVLIEALASGIPVIATRCGGPDDIVTEEVGLLVDCHDVTQLANAMQCMLNDHADYPPLGLHQYAEDHFSEQVVAQALRQVYEHVLLLQEKVS